MRCKACDNVFNEAEVIWRTHLNVWEDLCRTCLYIVFSNNDELPIPEYMLTNENVGEIDNDAD